MCYIAMCMSYTFWFKVCQFKVVWSVLCLLPATAREVWRCHLNLDMLWDWHFFGLNIISCSLPQHSIGLIDFPNIVWLEQMSHQEDTEEVVSPSTRLASFNTWNFSCQYTFLIHVCVDLRWLSAKYLVLLGVASSEIKVPNPVETALTDNFSLMQGLQEPCCAVCIMFIAHVFMHAKQCNKNCNSQS